MAVFAEAPPAEVKPYRTPRVKNGEAVGRALDYLLENNPRAFLFGLDVGVYGSAFKTCKGLIERHGPERVLDMPLCESAMVGFALGASQAGGQPILEFQFADFSTEAVTQLGLNAGTWYFRTGQPAPLLLRLPCGGGLTMGAFHSGEFEGLWSRFPGPEAALSGHRPGDVRGPGGRLLRSQPVPGLRAQAALLEQGRRDRLRRQPGVDLAAAALHRGNRRDAGGLRGDGPRGPGGGRPQPALDRGLEPVRASADGPRADPGIGVQDGPAAGGAGVRGDAGAGRPRDRAGLPRGARRR